MVNSWSCGYGNMVLTAFPWVNDLRYNVIYEGFRIDNEYHVKDVHVKPTNSCRQKCHPFSKPARRNREHRAPGRRSQTIRGISTTPMPVLEIHSTTPYSIHDSGPVSIRIFDKHAISSACYLVYFPTFHLGWVGDLIQLPFSAA